MKQEIIFHNLIGFNGFTLSKKQWEVILRGCECPKSYLFWRALRNNVLTKLQTNVYRLHISSMCDIEQVWNEYCEDNRAFVKAAYYKKKAQSNWGFNQTIIYNNCTFK